MKRIAFTLILISLVSMFAAAQTEHEDVAIAQAIFGKTKKEIILGYVKIPVNEQDAFWAVYDQYEVKDDEINLERIALIKRFANNYDTLNNEVASKIAEDYIDNSEKYFELYKSYFPKFKKVIGAVNAAAIIQMEIYIQTAIQARLQSQIPIIGELEKHEY